MEKRKMTKKETVEMLIGVLKGEIEVEDMQVFIDYLENEKELLEKKSARSGQTKNQKENEVIKKVIMEVLTSVETPMTITEIQRENESLNELSNQKMSSLLKQLIDSGLVERVPDKKKTLFKAI